MNIVYSLIQAVSFCILLCLLADCPRDMDLMTPSPLFCPTGWSHFSCQLARVLKFIRNTSSIIKQMILIVVIYEATPYSALF